MERKSSFTKERTTFQKTLTYDKISLKHSMITKPQDTPESSKHIMLFDNITGGLAYAALSKITFKDVAFANSSKSTGHPRNPHTFLPKEQNQQDLLQIVLWT